MEPFFVDVLWSHNSVTRSWAAQSELLAESVRLEQCWQVSYGNTPGVGCGPRWWVHTFYLRHCHELLLKDGLYFTIDGYYKHIFQSLLLFQMKWVIMQHHTDCDAFHFDISFTFKMFYLANKRPVDYIITEILLFLFPQRWFCTRAQKWYYHSQKYWMACDSIIFDRNRKTTSQEYYSI